MTSLPQKSSQPLVKLLVPYNFTPKSDLALDFALAYSHNHNAEIYLFHVFERVETDYRRVDKLNEECLDRMKQTVMDAISRLHTRGLSPSVENVHRRVGQGKPWIEILRMTAGIVADMVIMGAPRSAHFKRLILKAPCTVVLVREKDPAFVAP